MHNQLMPILLLGKIMMKIECDCGKFKAELIKFAGNNPGRLVCYCDDCQSFAKKLGREDLLDPYGGTEIIPVYPNNYKIVEGEEFLQCNLLREKGLNRWSVTCCNTSVANTMPKFPWVGIIHKAYTNADPQCLEKLGISKVELTEDLKRQRLHLKFQKN